MIDGPRMPPAAGGKPNALIVLCHGYGSNGDDLISLAPYWARTLAHAQFVSPHAPEPLPGMPGAYQWWPIGRPDPGGAGVTRAGQILDRFLDEELYRYGLDDSRLALVGFSQGTMMALHCGLRREKAPAAILGFSGTLTAPERLKEEARGAPPICLIHGDQDDRIPVTAMFKAGDALCEAGLSAQWHVSYGVGHSIAQDGLDLGGAFLKMALQPRQATAIQAA
jgi:phospholipase/carboxylesterase